MKATWTALLSAAVGAIAGCRNIQHGVGDSVLAQERGQDLLTWARSPTTRPRAGESVPSRVCFVGRVVEIDKKDGAVDSRMLVRVERWVVGGPADGRLAKEPVAVYFKIDEWRERFPSPNERWVIGCWLKTATEIPVFTIDTACAQYPAIPVDGVVN
jgi:hypothetical protein